MDEPLLAGRTVILTGAAGGIGRHVARALGAAGARVALTDLAGDAVETLALELAGEGSAVSGGIRRHR